MSTEAKIKHTALDLGQFHGHTPEPWTNQKCKGAPNVDPWVSHELGMLLVCGKPYGVHIAKVNSNWGDESMANARLIAAAPRLLAELRRNRRLLEAGERLAKAGQELIATGVPRGESARRLKVAQVLAAYQEAAK